MKLFPYSVKCKLKMLLPLKPSAGIFVISAGNLQSLPQCNNLNLNLFSVLVILGNK